MKLTPFVPTRLYELTVLVEPALTETELSNLKDGIEKLVTKHKGSLEAAEDWGRKPLAYSIKAHKKNFTEALYLHWNLEFDADKAQAFERDMHLNGDVIRHLFVVGEKAPKQED